MSKTAPAVRHESGLPQDKASREERLKAVRKDYIRGNGSIAFLCRRHGVAKNTGLKHARKERWTELKALFNENEIKSLVGSAPDLVLAGISKDSPDAVIKQNEAIRARIHEEMMRTSEPNELRDLSMAYDRLFSAWMVLTGTPKPGNRKVTESRRPSRARGTDLAEPEPEPPRPQAVAVSRGTFGDNKIV